MRAEDIYFFRHQLHRSAAYDLHLPADRARLHGWAMEALLEAIGGAPPIHTPLVGELSSPHATDPHALTLALHAAAALDAPDVDAPALMRLRLDFLWRAAAHASEKYRTAEAARLFEQIHHDDSENTPNRAEAARLAADMYRVGGQAQQAVPLYEAARDLAVQHGLHAELGQTLDRLGSQMRELGRVVEAEEIIREAIKMHRKVGNRPGEGRALRSLSIVLQQTGRMDEAVAGIDSALEIQLELNSDSGIAASLDTLGNLHLFIGEFDKAEKYYKRALETERRCNNLTYEGSTLGNLAILYADTGREEEAEAMYRRGIEIHREVGNRRSEGITIANLATLLHRLKRLDEARVCYMRALDIHREVANRRGEGVAIGHHAILLQDSGDIEGARQAFAQALRIHREVKNTRGEGVTLAHLADLQTLVGEHEQACASLTQAMKLHRENRNRRFEARGGVALGLILLQLGRIDEAREQWLRHFEMGKELGDAEGLKDAEAAMRKACKAAGAAPFLP